MREVNLDIIDEEHYIGTGQVFKKANVATKENIKKVKNALLQIGYKIDRAVNPQSFKEVRDDVDKFKTKFEACAALVSIVADSGGNRTCVDIEVAIGQAEEAGIDVSISFHGMSFFHKWQNLISVERHQEAIALMERSSDCVSSI